MSRQDKATTERNARILRDLVKQPDNKSCADCRKNDARWASWNLGVFLCIRCSGIHRSMGTHISKVKSIDLDIWTPEQMDNIQRWGNKRANLYWEKHLKAGHVPPDHKIESFIRSKYESKRWAMDGPPPRDPSVLEQGGGASAAPTEVPRPTPTTSAPAPVPQAAPQAAPKHHPLLSRTAKPAPTPAAPAPIVDLFGSDEPPSLAPPVTTTAPPANTSQPTPGPTAGTQPPAPTQGSSIFDLDFRTPTPSTQNQQQQQPKNAKADIMSLFSSASSPPATAPTSSGGFFNTAPPPPAQNQYASWNGGVTSSAPPQPAYQQTQAQLPTPTTGGGWGGISADQNAWGGGGGNTQTQPVQQNNPWGAGSNNTNDPWASSGSTGGGGGGGGGFFGSSSGNGLGNVQPQQKKDDRDPFANIWG